MTTRVSTVADGVTALFTIPFPYLDRSHVKVMLDGVTQPASAYTWVTSGSIQLVATPAAGVKVTRYRETPSDALTIYQSGSVLTRDQLEVDSLQALYRTEEAEAVALRLPADHVADTLLPALVPLAPLVVNSDATGVEMGSTTLTGDMMLRGELASTGAGRGAELVQFSHSDAGAGAVARLVRDKLRESVSVKDFGAVGDGVTDDTVAFQAAIDATAGVQVGSLLVPDGVYIINGATLTVPAGKAIGIRAQSNLGAHLNRSVAGDLFSGAGLHLTGLVMNHSGETGSSVVASADNFKMQQCGFNPGASNTSPVVVLTHANAELDGCIFALSNPAQWCVDVVANTGIFCINGSIRGGTMYGNGNGIRFRQGTGGRPEGWDVSGVKVILTGDVSVEVNVCLSLDITGCTLDQSSVAAVRLAPVAGGIDALTIHDNYIATASAPTTGVGILPVAGSGGIRSLSITNNHFELCDVGCILDSQIVGVRYTHNTSAQCNTRNLDYAGAVAVSIANNLFLGTSNLLRLVDGDTGAQVSVSGNNFDASGSVTYTPTDRARFEFSGNTGKKFSGWSSVALIGPTGSGATFTVPHGLAVAPDLKKIVGVGVMESGSYSDLAVRIDSCDGTNVYGALHYTLTTAGNLRVNLHCSA